jgi:predicted transcriptional regulator
LIAKRLIEDHSFTQTAAAKKLGTTQAAISYYISSKRGEKFVKQLENNPRAGLMIQDVVNMLIKETPSSEEVMDKLCDLCKYVRKSNLLDERE